MRAIHKAIPELNARTVDEALRHLKSGKTLEFSSSAGGLGGTYAFHSSLLRDVVYFNMTFEQRRKLHLAAAEVTLADRRVDSDARLLPAVHHYRAAEDSASVMRLAAAAARRALVDVSWAEALDLLELAHDLHERSAADARAELPPGTPAIWASLRAQAILGRLEASVSTPRGGRYDDDAAEKLRVEATAAAAAALEAALVGGLRAGGLHPDQRASRAPPMPSGGGFFAMCCGGGAAEVVVEAPTVTRNADDAVRVGVGAHASLLKLCLHAAAADGAPRAALLRDLRDGVVGQLLDAVIAAAATLPECTERLLARAGALLFRALEAAASPSPLPPPLHLMQLHSALQTFVSDEEARVTQKVAGPAAAAAERADAVAASRGIGREPWPQSLIATIRLALALSPVASTAKAEAAAELQRALELAVEADELHLLDIAEYLAPTRFSISNRC